MQIDLTNYNTIIFDFGGVILDINPELTINAFKNIGGDIGIKNMENSDILWQFERGEISKEELYKGLVLLLESDFSYDEFYKAWIALLKDFKPKRIEKIQELGKTHKLIMLSNTNELHYEFFSQKLLDEYGLQFTDLFEKVYLSNEMGLIKPNKAIYQQVIDEQMLIPEKTLFIEDTEANAIGARELGIGTLVIPRNSEFYEYFE